jgi:hypothetical protein
VEGQGRQVLAWRALSGGLDGVVTAREPRRGLFESAWPGRAVISGVCRTRARPLAPLSRRKTWSAARFTTLSDGQAPRAWPGGRINGSAWWAPRPARDSARSLPRCPGLDVSGGRRAPVQGRSPACDLRPPGGKARSDAWTPVRSAASQAEMGIGQRPTPGARPDSRRRPRASAHGRRGQGASFLAGIAQWGRWRSRARTFGACFSHPLAEPISPGPRAARTTPSTKPTSAAFLVRTLRK